MSPWRSVSLFSGVGALDMAANTVLGTETAYFCDNDPDAGKVLAHHWPNVPSLGDITAVDWGQVEPVEVVTAGFPCPDISSAGRKAGIKEGTRSGLWSEVVRAVRALRPRYLLVENVRDLVVRGLPRVAGDLAHIRYDLKWCCLPASAVGACHQRWRWFGLATPADTERPELKQRREPSDLGRTAGARPRPQRHGAARNAAGHRGAITAADADDVRPAEQVQPDSDGADGDAPRGVDVVVRGAPAFDWQQYAPAIRRWERVIGRRHPAPLVAGPRGGSGVNPAFTEWMQGLPAGHVTAVPGIGLDDQARLIGNSVVPMQAEAAFGWLLDGQQLGWAA